MIIDVFLMSAPGWLIEHAPALLVVVPLLLAPLCAIIPNGRVAWLLSVIGSFCALICAIIMTAQVRRLTAIPDADNFISYAMGGWQPPLGIEFRIDALNALVLLIVSGIGALASIFSWPSVQAEVRKEKHAMFYSAYLICFTGLLGVAATGDAFNLFVFLEILSLIHI